jgi:hypothetical protein
MPLAPSVMNGIFAPLIRPTVTPAPPLVTMVAFAGATIPMSEARIERIGPTSPGIVE